jgi:hypothetical protein
LRRGEEPNLQDNKIQTNGKASGESVRKGYWGKVHETKRPLDGFVWFAMDVPIPWKNPTGIYDILGGTKTSSRQTI